MTNKVCYHKDNDVSVGAISGFDTFKGGIDVRRFGSWLTILILALSVLTTAMRLAQVSALAENLTDNSPTAPMMTGGGDTDATRHILITSDHGDAYTIKLGLYYPYWYTGSQTVTIEGGNTTRCRFNTTHTGTTEISGTRNVYRVWFNGYTNDTSLLNTYSEACNSSNETRSRSLTIPASVVNSAPVDGSTNYLFKRITMTINLVPGMQGANDPNVDGSMTFGVKAVGSKVGLVDTLDSENNGPNNSFVARRNLPNPSGQVRLEIPFGLDCTQGTQSLGKVILFDADNGQGSNNLTYVVQRYNGGWQTLPRGALGTPDTITEVANVSIAADGTVHPDNSPPAPNKAVVYINTLHAREQYRMVIKDLNIAPSYNYIYLGVPGDSIFGTSSVTCVQTASGRMSLTPDPTSYVEPGGNVTTTGGINNTGTATAQLEYNHSIWYGSNNDDYNAGDQGLQTTGWVAVNIAAKTNPDVHTFTWNNISPPAGAKYVCAKFQIRNRGIDETQLSATTIIKCTPIGKAPSFAVKAGGVRTGGNYGAGTCSVTPPAYVSTSTARAYFYGITAHDYSGIDSINTHHTYIRDSALSLGYINNVVTKQAGIGSGANTELHFARGPGPVAAPNTSMGGGQFYGTGSDNIFPSAIPTNSHCLTDMFEVNRYPSATTPINIGSTTTQSLPAPSAGINAVTYNICGNVADNLLTLTGPAGGELVLQPGQQYVVRITQLGTGCNNNPVYVNIASNIRYTGTAATIADLPQFVFLAGTDSTSRVVVQVDNAVTRLDGIFANRGTNDDQATFLTCAQRANASNRWTLKSIAAAECSNQLTINGAIVLGGRLDPYRTTGHDNNTNTDPAEIFNLRPDTILSDYSRDRNSSQLDIINQRELAPRF